MSGAATSPLFRVEAFRHREERLAGAPLAIGAAWRFGASLVCLACLGGIGAALTYATYAPRQTVVGYLTPQQGLVKIYATRPGLVLKLLVRDGDVVHVDQPLAEISVEHGLATGEGASAPEQILRELETREKALSESLKRDEDLSTAQDGRLAAKAIEIRKQLSEIDAELKVLEKRIAAAEELTARTEKLRVQGFATPSEVTYRKDLVLGLQRDWYALTRSETALATELADLELQQKQIPSQLRQKQLTINNQLSEIRQQKAALQIERAYTVTATAPGRVTALQAEAGTMIAPSQPMLAILPESAVLEARLLVPSRAIGFTREGQRVRMRYSAFPFEQYGMQDGVIKEVSRLSLRPDEAPSALPVTEATYRVTVALARQSIAVEGRAQPLQSGMLLEADLLEEPRPLWSWIFKPILAVRGRL